MIFRYSAKFCNHGSLKLCMHAFLTTEAHTLMQHYFIDTSADMAISCPSIACCYFSSPFNSVCCCCASPDPHHHQPTTHTAHPLLLHSRGFRAKSRSAGHGLRSD